MVLANAFILGLHLFSDLGIGPSLIQNKRGEEQDFINTAYTLQVIRGLGLWLVTLITAVPFALFYEEPLYAWILPMVGLTALIEGFTSTKPLTANRNLIMGRLTLVELLSQIIGLIAMVLWALRWPSVWALVIGAIVTSSARTVLNHYALPGVGNRFHWDKPAFQQLMHFGRWIFLSTILTFLTGQADRLVYGKVVDEATLAIFYIAANIAILPSSAIENLMRKVAFPLLSQVHNTAGNFLDSFRRLRWKACLLSGWGTAGLLGGGPTIVRLIYDDRYLAGGWMLQIIAVAIWWSVLENTNGTALLAKGLARWIAVGSGAKLIGMVLFMIAGYLLGGFPGMLLGSSISEFARYLVSTYAIRKEHLYALDQDALLTLLVVVSSAAGWFVAQYIHRLGYWVAVESAAVFLVVSIFWLPFGIPHLRRMRRQSATTG
jgi:O-antigen/teichoic acid export membrane protein